MRELDSPIGSTVYVPTGRIRPAVPRNEALRLPQPVPAAVVVMSDGRFAGVDWASEEHAVCVVDQRGRILEGRRYRHNEPGIRALCSRLLGLGVALVALEQPDGLLIERLLDAGLTVVAVHPNQVKAMRPRYSVAGGKSDSFDSFVLASSRAPTGTASGCSNQTATRPRRYEA